MTWKNLAWVGEKIRTHKKRHLFLIIAETLFLVVVIQFLYPPDKLLPFTSIEGLNFSGWSRADAIQALDEHDSQNTGVAIYLGESSENLYSSPSFSDVGVSVDNEQRVNGIEYPWYLRIIPLSLVWSGFIINDSSPLYSVDSVILASYIKTEFGDKNCKIEPKNATVIVDNDKLVAQGGVPGGTCNIDEVSSTLASNLTKSPTIHLPMQVQPPDVSNAEAQALANKISQAIASGVNVVVLGETVTIPRDKLLSWLDFKAVKGELSYSFNTKRANDYLDGLLASKVKVEATSTAVTTNDFVETSRVVGSDGQKLDVAKTLDNIKKYVDGDASLASVGLAKISSPVKYTRNYTNTYTGMVALMKNFASSHAGTYGIALVELSGQYRSALYNGDKQFVTASTYKLFVAYSTLLRIESGAWKWSDQVEGGKDITKCFDDMIVLSDNECAKALEIKVGFSELTNEAHAIGCSNTSFLGSNIVSTPRDLAKILSSLATGSILKKQATRDVWINAMKRNVYRQGVPTGVSYTVADKVGFLWSLLHDAAIVYSPHGTYVLVIMTDGSSWANIAALTSQLDALINK